MKMHTNSFLLMILLVAALHVYVGLIVFLATAVLLKRSLADWRPIGMVLLASITGELWDLVDALVPNKGMWAESCKDALNTMFWPAALFGLARFTSLLKR